MSYLQSAFNQVCKEAKQASTYYVCLVETYQAYGGPEEGGWWYNVNTLVAYQEFPSEESANEAREKVEQLAKDLEEEASREYGEYCLRSCEWLEARGLDADFFPEPDGPTRYHVFVDNELPVYQNARPHYC